MNTCPSVKNDLGGSNLRQIRIGMFIHRHIGVQPSQEFW